jgi:hypothetical protein
MSAHGTTLAKGGFIMSPASDRSPTLGARVVACTLPGRRVSDAVEVVSTNEDRLSVVLLDVRAGREQETLRARLATAAHASLEAHEPMHVLVGGLRTIVCEAVAASVGVVALRISELDARVELLNAGMPPVACVLQDGRMLEFPALSADVGPRMHRAHPYELIPLAAGSIWVVASDGATAGSHEDAGELWNGLGLPEGASELSRGPSDALAGVLGKHLGSAPRTEDASVVVVPTRGARRPESGIR